MTSTAGKCATFVACAAVFAPAALGAVAWHTWYVHPHDVVIVDDLDLSCSETAPPVPVKEFGCGNTSTGNGPYVRIFPGRIDVVTSNQRLLFRVKRDR